MNIGCPSASSAIASAASVSTWFVTEESHGQLAGVGSRCQALHVQRAHVAGERGHDRRRPLRAVAARSG